MKSNYAIYTENKFHKLGEEEYNRFERQVMMKLNNCTDGDFEYYLTMTDKEFMKADLYLLLGLEIENMVKKGNLENITSKSQGVQSISYDNPNYNYVQNTTYVILNNYGLIKR